MKNTLIFFIVSFIPILTLSQPFENDWIVYSQKYYRIPVTEDGIYRIDRDVLEDVGVPVDLPDNMQIFYKGEEQYIYVKTEFGLIDFIEFYAEKNTGWLDTSVYNTQESHANPYYSLFNDTSTYFLTWNTSFDNRRLTIENDTDFVSYTPSVFCYKNILDQYTSNYYSVGSNPEYTACEGWFGSRFGKKDSQTNTSQTKTVPTGNAYLSGPATQVEICVISTNDASSSGEYNHHLSVGFLNITWEALYHGYQVIRLDTMVSSSQLISDETDFLFSCIDDLSVLTDRQAVSYISVLYPHNYDFEGTSEFGFSVPDAAGDKSYLEITNFSTGGSAPVLYDLTYHKRVEIVIDNDECRALIPDETGQEKVCYISSENAITYISDITPIRSKVGMDGFFTDYYSTYKSTDYIMITHPVLWNNVSQYMTYRESTGHNPAMINIEELYDQFAYGIEKHPLAIRNFVNYMIETWDSIPEHLFLIGKATYAGAYRNSDFIYNMTYVPSMGEPPSDVLITAGLNNTLYEPPVPTGRLGSLFPDQVDIYLSKVMEYESSVDSTGWKKNVLHFGGGLNTSEQNQFANYLEEYEVIIEDTLFGANVSTFIKNSSQPIENTATDSIKSLINNGVTLMTFFGHGSPTGFDQDIDDPSAYENQGKYPFILANSCYAGDIFTQHHNSQSEQWMMIEDKGCIGFMAVVDLGYPPYLHDYSEELYRNITYKNYGNSIAKCIKETIYKYQYENDNYLNPNVKSTCFEFTLHGDPALVLNAHALPDLMVNSNGVYFDPYNITTEMDSFNVDIVVTNIGKAIKDTFIVEINRVFPDESYEITEKIMTESLFKDTVTITLPVDKINGPGLNRLDITVDSKDSIVELSEFNNSVSVYLIIESGDITPIYPYKYAIYPNSTVTLKASTGNVFAPEQTYLFQADTNDMFSPPLISDSVIHQGGIVPWQLPMTMTDTTVYYWRVCRSEADPGDNNWKESSFIYIPTKTGWSQAHFFQFKNDDYNYIEFNRPERKFDFITTPKHLHCYNLGSPSSYQEYMEIFYDIDGASAFSCCGSSPAYNVVVIDSLTLNPWESNYDDFGQRNYPVCSGPYPDRYLVFSSTEQGRNDMLDMLVNHVEDGNYILIYTFRTGYFDDWTEDQYLAMESLGADTIRYVPDNYPYIFFVKKGNLSTAREMFGTDAYDDLDFHQDLETDFYYGDITSEIIGPSSSWETLHWRQHTIDADATEEVKLKVIGIDNSGNENVLMNNIFPGNYEIDLYDSINATAYPYLKLNMFNRDDDYQTPAQLDKWQIYFDGVPETALNPSEGYYFYSDTLQEGDDLVFSVATENISPYDMDSLLIGYYLKDKNNNFSALEYRRKRPHPAGDVLMDTITFNTLGYPGLNSVWIEVNPENPSTGAYDQPEQYHFNNIAEKYFYVQRDITNPILDVTFDGVHILDGDIVSAEPDIMIKLNDENKYLALNDTSLFTVYLKSYNTGTEERIYFIDDQGNEQLQWTPAELPDNSCEIFYSPEFIEDGIYELRVQAKDKSENESGSYYYAISFEIVTRSTITDIFNYPNPFSTSTRFVFELTGSEIPTDLRIQILTVTGKLVRVITLDELGNIHIGRNITDYAWDGTDMYGDRLANGVYFYKVIATLNGEEIEKRQTGTEQYFHKGFGKMYLIR